MTIVLAMLFVIAVRTLNESSVSGNVMTAIAEANGCSHSDAWYDELDARTDAILTQQP